MLLSMQQLTWHHTVAGDWYEDVGQESPSEEWGASSLAVAGCPETGASLHLSSTVCWISCRTRRALEMRHDHSLRA